MKYRQSTKERVKQLRALMLIHSYLYYVLDEPIVSDHQWQDWADELVLKQKLIMAIDFYDYEFCDWDASSGYHLPRDEWVKRKAVYILQLHKKLTRPPQKRKTLRKQLTFF